MYISISTYIYILANLFSLYSFDWLKSCDSRDLFIIGLIVDWGDWFDGVDWDDWFDRVDWADWLEWADHFDRVYLYVLNLSKNILKW